MRGRVGYRLTLSHVNETGGGQGHMPPTVERVAVKPLGPFSDIIYSITQNRCRIRLRAAQSSKTVRGLGQNEAVDLLSLMGVAGIMECFGGGLIMLWLFTPWVTFLVSGEMAFAYFLSHNPRGSWPVMDGVERAVLYCFIFLYFATRGSGSLRVDRIVWGRTRA